MMPVKTRFNELEKDIIREAERQGIPRERLNDVDYWILRYETQLDRYFKYAINKLNEDVKLLKQAISRHDMVSAKIAIVRVQGHIFDVADSLAVLDDNVIKFGWGEELKGIWPQIPEDYQIPADYDYDAANHLSYQDRKNIVQNLPPKKMDRYKD